MFKKMSVFVLSALVALLTIPCSAYAAELQAQSVKIICPDGNVITAPDGSTVDLSKSKKKSSTTAAQKKANKAWKKSGLQTYGKKYGWSCKKTWTKKSSTKAVRKAHFYYDRGTNQRFMDIIQTTTKKSGKWTTTYKSGQDGKTYDVRGFKWTLRHSAPTN